MVKFNRSFFSMLVSLGILAGGCASSNQATTETESSPVVEPTTETSVAASPDASDEPTADTGNTNSHGGQGGQVGLREDGE